MATPMRQYKGSRYVPIFGRKDETSIQWDNTKPYEPLTIVLYQGNSYTSRQYVPTGVDIANEEYWALTGNYNAQVEAYRQEVQQFDSRISALENVDYEIVEDYNGLKASTADYVYVLKNNTRCDYLNVENESAVYPQTKMGNDDGCWYSTRINEYSNQPEIYGGYKRDNGTVVFALPDQGTYDGKAPMTTIGDCIATYFNRSNLIYGHQNTMFMDVCANGEIDCTTFTAAIIYGIDYPHSRYTLGTNANNVIGSICSKIMPSTRGKYLMYLSEMAEWFAENKRLFSIKGGTTNPVVDCGIQPGDILFSNNYNESPSRVTNYYGIDHCSVVLMVQPNDGTIVIAQAGHTDYPATFIRDVLNNNEDYKDRTVKISVCKFNEYAGDVFQVYARPDYKQGVYEPIDVTDMMYENNTTVSPETTINFLGSKPTIRMEYGKLYSLCIEGSALPKYEDDGCYMFINMTARMSDNTDKNITIYQGYHMQTDGNHFNSIICIPYDEDIKYIKFIGVRIYNTNDSIIGEFHVDAGAILHGIGVDMAVNKFIKLNIAESFEQTVAFAHALAKPSGVYLDLQFTGATTAADNVLIGTFDDNFPRSNAETRILGTSGYVTALVFRIPGQSNELRYSSQRTNTEQVYCVGKIAERV